jgi:3-methyladenine DNA glycosylase AlkD
MIKDDIRAALFAAPDLKYRDFQAKLIPNLAGDTMIGVRTPELRKMARQLAKRPDVGNFLKDLPHRYFDENQIHAFILSDMKDYDRCIEEVNLFLPFVDNWATCDQMSPKVFKKHRPELLTQIRQWIRSRHTYTVRFGAGMLMQHYLDEDFDPDYPALVGGIHSEEYYINMMIAWYFATALAKQYEAVLPWLEEKRLEPWVHNKTIQKAIESYRISAEQKAYLRTLKVSRSTSG